MRTIQSIFLFRSFHCSFVRPFVALVSASVINSRVRKVCMCFLSLSICPSATPICFLFSRKSREPIETMASVIWIDSRSDTFCDQDNFSTEARLVLCFFLFVIHIQIELLLFDHMMEKKTWNKKKQTWIRLCIRLYQHYFSRTFYSPLGGC